MPIVLPPSLRRELHPIEEEVAPYRDMAPETLLRWASMACRVAADIARARPDRDEVFAWRDPLPPSTEAAFRRLGIRWNAR